MPDKTIPAECPYCGEDAYQIEEYGGPHIKSRHTIVYECLTCKRDHRRFAGNLALRKRISRNTELDCVEWMSGPHAQRLLRTLEKQGKSWDSARLDDE